MVRDTRPVVLLLEDDGRIRRAMRRMLEPEGYEVLEAESGVQALERAAAGVTIDLLISDLGLPGMSGEALASQLRAVRPRLKVLYVSVHIVSQSDERRARGEGEAFLGKPFTRRDLLGAVSAMLPGNPAQPS